MARAESAGVEHHELTRLASSEFPSTNIGPPRVRGQRIIAKLIVVDHLDAECPLLTERAPLGS